MSETKKGESDFNALLHGDFTLAEKDKHLYRIAKRYYKETEAFNQNVCSAKNARGIAMPMNTYEFRLINKNALKVRRRLLNENSDICQEDLDNIISRLEVAKMSKDSFTEQWTQKSFTNTDGDKMRIEQDKDDFDVMSICIGDEEFWFNKKNAKNIAEALQQIAAT